jgi:hypothetical protein
MIAGNAGSTGADRQGPMRALMRISPGCKWVAEMGRTLDEWIGSLPPEQRQRVEERAAGLMAKQMSLRDLRKAMKKTQVAIARKLKVRQHGVSKIEQRTDMLLSTLRAYVQALGGELHLVAEFKNRPPVRLTEIGGIANERKSVGNRTRGRKQNAA